VKCQQTVEPGRLGPGEFVTCSAVGQHRAFARRVDEHHDRSGRPTSTHDSFDTISLERRDEQVAERIGPDLTDEPSSPAGTSHGDRHVRRTPAATTLDASRGVRCELDRATQPDGDVLDEVSDGSDHDSGR
jgi:hypothetical protein